MQNNSYIKHIDNITLRVPDINYTALYYNPH